MFEALIQDLRYGARLLGKNRGFAAVAVLTLALGIGANTAVFSLLDPLLLRTLPVDHPEDLVLLDATGTMGKAGVWEAMALDRFRAQKKVFSGVLAFAPMNTEDAVRDGRTRSARGVLVSGDYFDVLRARPYLGRLLTAEDDRGAFGTNTVVLGYDYWRREFRGDDAIVGKMVPIRDMTLTVVGVTPPEFFGVVVGERPDFYLPLKVGRPLKGEGAVVPGQWVTIVGRLQPGISLTQAQAGLEPVFRKIANDSDIPAVEQRQLMSRLLLSPAARGISPLREKFGLPARILMFVVGLVLLIACCNVANLLLAQGAARRREITVRLAVGAGRWRMVRQLATESALLALAGALAGLLLARWAVAALVAALATDGADKLEAGIDLRVLLFTLAVAALTVLLCGLVPALSATRLSLSRQLKTHTALAPDYLPLRLGNLFIFAQVAISVTVLVAAGLLLRSLVKLETFDAGFNRDRVLVVAMSGNIYGGTPQQVATFYDQLLRRVRALPGVQSASLSIFSPISGRELGINVRVEGYAPQSGENLHAFFNSVRPAYFKTLGIPILQGRDFSAQDNRRSPPVAIINRTMARHFFGDRSPLGKTFKTVEGNRGPFVIVGVAGDSKYNDLRETTPDFFYLANLQSAPLQVVRATLSVCAGADAVNTLAKPVRELVTSLDSYVAVTSLRTLREQIDDSLRHDRLITALCAVFSLLALALTCVGLYGVLSFSVARRTSEIGIRMALGATRGNIFRLVVGQGMQLAGAGLALGLVGGLLAAGLLKSLLFGVGRGDPATFAGICLLLVAAALLACYLPALRATRVDPLDALRNE